MEGAGGRQRNINTSTEVTGRIAIVDAEKCKPKKCNHQCSSFCPVNKTGKVCVTANVMVKQSEISEVLCIGCGICVKKCPFEAITIRNLPQGIPNQCVHRYGKNSFKLFRLPQPRVGKVLGIVGTNGIGKTTALSILTTRTQPNLGNFDTPPSWQEVIKHFRGSELQNYFQGYLEERFKSAMKPQYVDSLPKVISGKVEDIIKKKDQRNMADVYYERLSLENAKQKEIKVLSGGELQRFSIMVALLQKVSVYMFDEPTSYLDVKQRLTVSDCVREMVNADNNDNYVMVVEHDLSILDYMSDYICVLYGEPSVYGVATVPHGVAEGINDFLRGYLTSENMEIRKEGLSFQIKDNLDEIEHDNQSFSFKYPSLKKKLGTFELEIDAGEFTTSQIIVLLGENGTGKTTFVKILAGLDKELKGEVPELKISYKPQTISPTFEGTVQELLWNRIGPVWESNIIFKQFIFNVCNIAHLFQRNVQQLSGGELQRVGLIVAFGKPADVYLIDEPSAYLDCEQRLLTAKGIKRFILHTKKTAFVVEHDFIMATYLADKVIVYEGEPGAKCKANKPANLVEGMNKFLSILQITFRRDPSNARPRINKLDSLLDKNQKSSGNYFCSEA
jgi:ATP-binding cassette subfamily E protein 1